MEMPRKAALNTDENRPRLRCRITAIALHNLQGVYYLNTCNFKILHIFSIKWVRGALN
jgi:hypothetical protein